MSQALTSLAARLLSALVDAGSWCSRVELHAACQCSDVALEDALADLVIAGQVDWRENVGYRLAGTNVCRRAAQLRQREGKRAGVVGVPGKEGYRVGVAEVRADLGLVMYELALPLAQPDEDPVEHHLRQVRGVTEFVRSIEGGA
ncbi:hypothetical protein [Aquabacterium sp.]|uniref:hypothetical protein n=1 Tax=Aquabacterium sp. TaxID=1872578 RepID=UPI0025C12812|nr:hypothetical protein [Aquabacterium sp.]